MEPLELSESPTSRSPQSMDIDDDLSVLDNSPRSPTPLNDTLNSGTDADKGIVVEAPTLHFADSSVIMPDQDEEDEETLSYARRKRPNVNYQEEDSNKVVAGRGSYDGGPPAKRKQGKNVRGVCIGVWRDSDLPNDADKHVIYGFIDIHDRLRTRIYSMNRRHEELIANAPTGAGGCWVTFERVIFDDHLKGLTAAQVKEYVKIRSEQQPEATDEERHQADLKAVVQAKAYVAEQEAASPGYNKPVVHRTKDRSNVNPRHSLPRHAPQKTPSFQAVNAADMQTPPSPFTDSKPSGVLLGYWADSDEPLLEDKHAVYGVLSGTDCFRVKVQRVTRDGRFVDGNFPSGAGALWLHYEKVVLEPHLAHLNRAEVKEYVRVRQREQEHRESTHERKANEIRAVQRAQAAAQGGSNGIVTNDPADSPSFEPRHSARSEHRQSKVQVDDNAAERARKEKLEARERQHEKTRKEVAMAEQVIQEAAQMELKHNLKKLNKVWMAQQQATLEPTRASSNAGSMFPETEIKFHNGIKYERKQTGPFEGKLVSQPQIFTIDGEDYVEYRILTKPSFA